MNPDRTNQESGRVSEWGGFSQLLGGPCIGRMSRDVEMDDFSGTVNHEEEREDGAEQHVVVLEKVAGPQVWRMVPDEGAHVWPRFPGGRTYLMYF